MMAMWRSSGAAWPLMGLPSVPGRGVPWGLFRDEIVAIGCACEATLPFPCDEGTRFCVLVNLDLQNFMLLGLADLLHLIDETVGELLQPLIATFQLILGNFFLFLTLT